MKLSPLSMLECRKGDVKLPNTTITSLYARCSGMSFFDNDDFDEGAEKFAQILNLDFKRNEFIEFDLAPFNDVPCLVQVSLPIQMMNSNG